VNGFCVSRKWYKIRGVEAYRRPPRPVIAQTKAERAETRKKKVAGGKKRKAPKTKKIAKKQQLRT